MLVRFQSHQVLGRLLQLSLAPVEITVNVEVDLLGESPKADVLLLRREGKEWNAAQRARLPDGLRDSAAGHVLLEFKYTESVNENALAQAVAYDYFYRQAQRLPEEHVLTAVLSARTPQKARLAEWGYRELQDGVYRSPLPLLRRVWLLVLNDLPPSPHNAYVKLFASREQEREAAFAALDAPTLTESPPLYAFMIGLQRTMDVKGESNMAELMTPDKIMEIGEEIRQRVLETATPEERLAGLAPQERLAGLEPQERLEGLGPQERLEGLEPQERLAGLTDAERKLLFRLLREELGTPSGKEADGDGDAP